MNEFLKVILVIIGICIVNSVVWAILGTIDVHNPAGDIQVDWNDVEKYLRVHEDERK